MPVVTADPKTQERVGTFPDTGFTGPPPGGGGGGGFGGDGRGQPSGGNGSVSSFPISKERLLAWLVLTGISMLFAGLASAYIITSSTSIWESVVLPQLLWLNTFVLLASSVTMERTRSHIQQGRIRAARIWVAVTGVLGLAFLIGQLTAWREMVDAGVFLQSTLHAGYFYVLSGLHGLHLAGGLSFLGYIWVQIVRGRYSAASHEPVSLAAMYWHFMDGLWVCVFLLLILV